MTAPSSAIGQINVVLAPTGFPQPVRCWIDGHEAFSHETRGGLIPVAPGTHTVTCEAQGMGGFGKQSLTVQVAAGDTVTVHYAVPHSHISVGSIGLEPQTRRAGLDIRQIGISLGGAALLLLCCGGIGMLARWFG